MSMYNGVFVGVGYPLTEEERVRLLGPVIGSPRYEEIMDEFHPLDTNRTKWFFGEIIYEIPEGKAVAIDTIAKLPVLCDDGSFGIKYGSILCELGVPAEEINTTWDNPNIYIVHWEDC